MANPTGAWKCPMCGFVLMKRILYAQSGNVGVDRNPITEPCPNDGAGMKMIPPDDLPMTPDGKIDLRGKF